MIVPFLLTKKSNILNDKKIKWQLKKKLCNTTATSDNAKNNTKDITDTKTAVICQ